MTTNSVPRGPRKVFAQPAAAALQQSGARQQAHHQIGGTQ